MMMMMMLKQSTTFFLLLQVFFLLIVCEVTYACKCMKPTASKALSSPTSSIFTGTVIRRKKSMDPNLPEIATIVSVDRIIKGCTLDLSDRIIVTTATTSAACGVNLKVNETYFFTGDIEPLDADLLLKTYDLVFPNNPIQSKVHASSCNFNIARRNVGMKVRNMLFDYGTNKNICPTKCIVGTDCPNEDYYCDSEEGTCQLFVEPCPPDRPPAPCAVDPCTVMEPCKDDLLCTPYYCGTCAAIFTDTNRTRTCKA